MTDATHSPLPWRTGAEYPSTVFTVDAKRAGALVCQCDPHDKFSPVSEANAAMIVRAVNAHDALTEALAVLLDQVDYTKGACGPTEMVGAVLPRDVITKARAALKLATH